ncbi:hypothetical protein [Candidatus Nitrotoga arctica]|uniref:Uncharacterized protein n=1 Tax=Candidatus Nitrotoga arctica TaxID=453162 RepID=A0ABM8Z1Z5_9PROT|nr:hypothetical protein [Candidatus Nitrotoga arctica]CAG9933871.1 protein of unknown function [Candidatus Nitrotoga arctica]
MLASAQPANAAVSSRLNKRVAAAALNANAVITAHASKAKPKKVVIEGAVCLQSIATHLLHLTEKENHHEHIYRINL